MSTSSGSDNGVKVKPLSNSNYQEWSGEAKAYLMRLGLWRLVAGRESKPSVAAELTKWEAKAEKAAGEIYLLVEADQIIHFRGLEDDPVGMCVKIRGKKRWPDKGLNQGPSGCFPDALPFELSGLGYWLHNIECDLPFT